MAYTKRVWKGRQGTGLNKFSIDGATPVTVVNQPDSLIEAGDALSAGNLNDLETRIDDAFDAVDAEVATKADETEVTDLKNSLTAVDHRVQNLEQAKGDYVPVDSTKGVISVPSGKGKWAVVEKLRGVTRGKNQLVQNYNFASGTTGFSPAGGTLSASGNVLSYTLTSIQENDYYNGISADSTGQHTVVGHTYLICADVTLPHTPASNHFNLYVGGEYIYFQPTANTKTKCVGIATAVNTNNAQIHVAPFVSDGYAVGDIVRIENWFIRDLTLYFGSTVPTLAEIQQYYPWLLEPSDYGTSLVDSVYEGVKSVGVNIWDEEWEVGSIDNSTGLPVSDSSNIRSKNFTRVVPSTAYYFMTSSGKDIRYYWYDINQNFISSSYAQNVSATSPSNAFYLKIRTTASYGSTYNHDIQICLNSASDKTTYHPYMTDTLSLPTTITLRSAGSVAEEFDLKSGEVTRPVGVASNLGSYTWMRRSDGLLYTSTAVLTDAYNSTLNVQCAKYLPPNADHYGTSTQEGHISISSGGYIYVMDNTFSTADAFKTAMANVALYYELATPNAPTQLSPIQNPTILTEAGGTISAQTEEPIDGNFSVGFITL